MRIATGFADKAFSKLHSHAILSFESILIVNMFKNINDLKLWIILDLLFYFSLYIQIENKNIKIKTTNGLLKACFCFDQLKIDELRVNSCDVFYFIVIEIFS